MRQKAKDFSKITDEQIEHFESTLNSIPDSVSSEQLFNMCAMQKFESLYSQSSKELDECLNALYSTTDFTDVQRVGNLLKKLNRIICVNRKALLYNIKVLGGK